MTDLRPTILGAVASSAILLLVAGCATTAGPVAEGAGTVLPESTVAPLIADLPERSVAPLEATRLAKGLAPPTNRWFSGLVFGEQPQPVFPLPLSFALAEQGFGFGIPDVTSSPETISGGYHPAIVVDSGAASSEVSAYDDASVTIDQLDDGGDRIGSVVIAEGSPLVSFTAARDTDLSLPVPFEEAGDGVWSATVAEAEYGLVTDGSVAESSVSLAKGQTATWIAVPDDGDLGELATLASPLTSVDLSYGRSGSESTTTLEYRSTGDTLVAAMPHQTAALLAPNSCDLGSYESVYGAMSLCAGPTLSWSSPTIEANGSLDLGTLTDEQKNGLRQQVAEDAGTPSELPADTYFGGKALYRLANLLDLAVQLGDDESAALVQKQLNEALREWTEPDGCSSREERCFVYDKAARGIVGLAPSFGSDQFNDHHFHYGYFLYAASVAATHDPALTGDIAPVVDLLAADLATSGSTKYFPERRVFDAYAGHSWASGTAPFADGNNQESSSEAVTAWNGLALWAGITKDAALEEEASWLLSSEAASANAYWTDFDRSDPVYQGYAHSVASINWGAKRDYATWFSAEPNAKLAILALPMSPVADYLGGDDARIAENVAEAAPAGFEVTFGDYLLMYSALGGAAAAETALPLAEALPEHLIDDGNSRSYLLAWIMTRG